MSDSRSVFIFRYFWKSLQPCHWRYESNSDVSVLAGAQHHGRHAGVWAGQRAGSHQQHPEVRPRSSPPLADPLIFRAENVSLEKLSFSFKQLPDPYWKLIRLYNSYKFVQKYNHQKLLAWQNWKNRKWSLCCLKTLVRRVFWFFKIWLDSRKLLQHM